MLRRVVEYTAASDGVVLPTRLLGAMRRHTEADLRSSGLVVCGHHSTADAFKTNATHHQVDASLRRTFRRLDVMPAQQARGACLPTPRSAPARAPAQAACVTVDSRIAPSAEPQTLQALMVLTPTHTERMVQLARVMDHHCSPARRESVARVLFVDGSATPQGAFKFASVTQALLAAAEGDVVAVRPGTYEELGGIAVPASVTVLAVAGSTSEDDARQRAHSVRTKACAHARRAAELSTTFSVAAKSLPRSEFLGDAGDGEASGPSIKESLHVPARHTLVVSAESTLASHALLAGFKLLFTNGGHDTHPGPRRHSNRPVHVVSVTNRSHGAALSHCAFEVVSCGAVTCVAACTRAALVVASCSFTYRRAGGSAGTRPPPVGGLFAAGLSTLVVENSVLQGVGIEGRGGSCVMVKDTLVSSTHKGGIRMHEDAECGAHAVHVVGAGWAGVELSGGARCVLSRSTVCGSKKGGVLVQPACHLSMVACTVVGCAMAGVDVRSASINLSDCTIAGGAGHGLYMHGRAQAFAQVRCLVPCVFLLLPQVE